MLCALKLLNPPMCVHSKCLDRVGDFWSIAVLPSPWGVAQYATSHSPLLAYHQTIHALSARCRKTRPYPNVRWLRSSHPAFGAVPRLQCSPRAFSCERQWLHSAFFLSFFLLSFPSFLRGPLSWIWIQTPTLWRCPLIWGYRLPRLGRGPSSWGYGLPRFLCGPSSWGYGLPRFWRGPFIPPGKPLPAIPLAPSQTRPLQTPKSFRTQLEYRIQTDLLAPCGPGPPFWVLRSMPFYCCIPLSKLWTTVAVGEYRSFDR